jgi:hypothetical protein
MCEFKLRAVPLPVPEIFDSSNELQQHHEYNNGDSKPHRQKLKELPPAAEDREFAHFPFLSLWKRPLLAPRAGL